MKKLGHATLGLGCKQQPAGNPAGLLDVAHQPQQAQHPQEHNRDFIF